MIRWPALLLLPAAAFLAWWSLHNPLPDGFQNESLHVGNAYDLWGALRDGDLWHIRWYMYTGYWPWGFYALAWPILAVTDLSMGALLATNLVHLGVLIWAAARLGRVFSAPLAPLLVLLCPATFGALVRYEPNLANLAWVLAGLALLVESQGLRSRPHVLGFGLVFGLGLMFDRLTVAFFLGPALLPLLWAHGRQPRARANLALAAGLTLFLTVAWYREFFLRHMDELTSQVGAGEIDSAGHLEETGGLFPPLYYLFTLLDTQAGPLLGLALVGGLVLAVRKAGRSAAAPEWPLLAAAGLPLLLFTFIAKKQAYYTLPALGPLAVLAAARPRLAGLGLVGGLVAFATLGTGWLPPNRLAGPALPEALVSPRHTLARPPSFEDWPLPAALTALGEGGPPVQIAVLSEDEGLFEGFVVLAARERWPRAAVRGVIGDPVGTYELFDEIDAILTIHPRGAGWPDERRILLQLVADHYDARDLPPLAPRVAGGKAGFVQVGQQQTELLDLIAWRRQGP